jgi:hypothetical protein
LSVATQCIVLPCRSDTARRCLAMDADTPRGRSCAAGSRTLFSQASFPSSTPSVRRRPPADRAETRSRAELHVARPLPRTGSKPLQIWEKSVQNGHIKRITDNDIQSSVLEIMSTNISTTYVTCPVDPSKTLGIKLPFLVMIIKNVRMHLRRAWPLQRRAQLPAAARRWPRSKRNSRLLSGRSGAAGGGALSERTAPSLLPWLTWRGRRVRPCSLAQLKKYFTFEVQVLDDKNVRRRFRASNYQSTTRVKPFICTMPMRLDEGWNQIQFNLSDFTRRAYGTNYIETLRVQIHANCRIRRIYFSDRLYSEEELPPEFKRARHTTRAHRTTPHPSRLSSPVRARTPARRRYAMTCEVWPFRLWQSSCRSRSSRAAAPLPRLPLTARSARSTCGPTFRAALGQRLAGGTICRWKSVARLAWTHPRCAATTMGAGRAWRTS